ncbi:hypothetical protein [Nitrosomonas communis]|uniref:hypothetical protein n=1 Tax=Nitrosomonas communis TaxID=44574 RepID=UPI0009432A08|nr:hypothetical protein [Nitrosomonas communis]
MLSGLSAVTLPTAYKKRDEAPNLLTMDVDPALVKVVNEQNKRHGLTRWFSVRSGELRQAGWAEIDFDKKE